jgi:serine/threonine-protein kinase
VDIGRDALTAHAAVADAEFIAFQQAIAGRYSLERELGRGGMGIVYLAREVRLARPVAIKVLPRQMALSRPELRERFVREAQMAARLSHPNIVPIHHVDEAGEFVFFVMAYIDGETLGDRLRARGAVQPADAARILREIAWALAYAHRLGIVHRDVKPDNILLERESNRALVSDFGIAGAANTATDADAGYIRGTAHYLSPEQASGGAVDARSDIYSLGVLGYYALAGRLPFEGATASAVLTAHLTETPEPLARAAPAVPHRLAQAVDRCLEKDPDHRWPSGEKFAEAVDAAFEPPREIPAPLRAWLSRNERDQRGRIAVSLYITLLSAGFAVHNPLATLFIAGPLISTLLLGPEIARARRLLALGFTLDDMRAALHTFTMRRREELVYEAAEHSVFALRTLAVVTTVGVVSAVVAGGLAFGAGAANVAANTVFTLGAIAGVAGAVAFVGEALRQRMSARFGSRLLKFWNGVWGERLARLSALGLKRPAVAQSALPQYTEVALGRATDALFAALPKHLRKELKDVPETVRRLESDAKALRETLDTLDEAIGAAARVASDRGAVRDGVVDDRELRRRRDLAAERLAATVTALESIRLGLLRLRIGSAPVASVTEALEAASRVGRDISIVIAAEGEVQQALTR